MIGSLQSAFIWVALCDKRHPFSFAKITINDYKSLKYLFIFKIFLTNAKSLYYKKTTPTFSALPLKVLGLCKYLKKGFIPLS